MVRRPVARHRRKRFICSRPAPGPYSQMASVEKTAGVSRGDSMVTPGGPSFSGHRSHHAKSLQTKKKIGGAEGARTPDLVTASHGSALCQPISFGVIP